MQDADRPRGDAEIAGVRRDIALRTHGRGLLRILRILSAVYLLCVAGLCLAPYLSTNEWTIFTVLCYFPRAPLLLPPAALMLFAALWRQWGIFSVNLLSVLLVAGPVMGLSVGKWTTAAATSSEPQVRVLTSNIQGGAAKLYSLLHEIKRTRADVILLQEMTPKSLELVERELSDWKGVSSGEFWIGAREQPVLIGECLTEPFERKTAVACTVSLHGKAVTVVSVHLTTVRWGLEKLLGDPGPEQSRLQAFEHHEVLRFEEARQTRAWLKTLRETSPIVGGDFNTTPQCRLYTAHWSSLKNAFTEAGLGYGYTARCDDPAYWPANTPWVRIDHLLYGSAWRCVSVDRGVTAASDHRIVWADFVRASSSP